MRRTRAELTAIARARLREMGLRPPLDAHALADALGRLRGKPIHLVPTSELPPMTVFGVTGGDDTNDVVLYNARTSSTGQLGVMLHELAHVLLDHPREAVDHAFRGDADEEYAAISPDAVAALMGDPQAPAALPEDPDSPVDTETPRWRWPWRRNEEPADRPASLYDSDIEWEAETLGTVLMTWIPGYGGHAPPAPANALEDVLGDEGAW